MEFSYSSDFVVMGSVLIFPLEVYEEQEVGTSVKVGTGGEQVYSMGSSTTVINLIGTPN